MSSKIFDFVEEALKRGKTPAQPASGTFLAILGDGNGGFATVPDTLTLAGYGNLMCQPPTFQECEVGALWLASIELASGKHTVH
ncbi:hypothetical protein M2318_003929 [Metapseudomonas resinovorans]|uniref:hypothetical protein n=1 Tax=Metapseudomonas resinovorans TaxID=53412 RepID=UPI003D1CBE6C